MTNWCGQWPPSFVTLCIQSWMLCAPSVDVFLLTIHKCAVLPIYDNWMLWSICVLVVYFLLVAFMARYLSKPVFKHLLMGVHMHHPLTLTASLFLAHNSTVKVLFKVILASSSSCHIRVCCFRWRRMLMLIGNVFSWINCAGVHVNLSQELFLHEQFYPMRLLVNKLCKYSTIPWKLSSPVKHIIARDMGNNSLN